MDMGQVTDTMGVAMLLATMEVDTHLHITEDIRPATTMVMHRFTPGTDIAGSLDPPTPTMEVPVIMVDGVIEAIAAGNGLESRTPLRQRGGVCLGEVKAGLLRPTFNIKAFYLLRQQLC